MGNEYSEFGGVKIAEDDYIRGMFNLAAGVRDERKKAFEALLTAAVELSKGGQVNDLRNKGARP